MKLMKLSYRPLFSISLFWCAFLTAPTFAHAVPLSITYTYEHHIFTLSVAKNPQWQQPKTLWYFEGQPAVPPSRLLTCGKDALVAPGWEARRDAGWDTQAIADSIAKEIGAALDRSAGSVRISRSASGSIVFEGQGLTGRKVDVQLAAQLTKKALDNDIGSVVLPVDSSQPRVMVDDPALTAMGIKEVVTVGESVFTGSPVNRRHNIATGVSKFNGHLIPKGSVFSFNEVLGPVNQTTGYRKELVIQGDETIPDYGGGLCQVSSTAYRGPWEYGLPIVQRKNHSYAVTYYSPQGTDATIYPPKLDLKFLNDTAGALLIQSFTTEDDHAYFIYYGTADGRTTEILGPFISNHVPAPREQRIVYTTELQPGERKKVGERHDGMQVMWYRLLGRSGSGQTMESYFSHYQARPLYYQVGVAPDDVSGSTLRFEPSWLPSSE